MCFWFNISKVMIRFSSCKLQDIIPLYLGVISFHSLIWQVLNNTFWSQGSNGVVRCWYLLLLPSLKESFIMAPESRIMTEVPESLLMCGPSPSAVTAEEPVPNLTGQSRFGHFKVSVFYWVQIFPIALIRGNTFVLKPSEKVSRLFTCYFFM
jgi:hypothetical protein